MPSAADRRLQAEAFAQRLTYGLDHFRVSWRDVASDPNDSRALALRAETLRAAWRADIQSRADYVVGLCRGQRVLDIGCVAHDIDRMSSSQWLHARIASAASECLGVDILPEGIEEMRRLGYEAICHNLCDGLGPLAGQHPFDVVLAGELFEHLGSVDSLLATARQLLSPKGRLIITTPNPWAPHRVRAGQRGYVWENVDHVVFAFPSGMAELAERHGLVLAEVVTVLPALPTVMQLPRAFYWWLHRLLHGGRTWVPFGYASMGLRKVVKIGFGGRLPAARALFSPRRRLTGETIVYVVTRPEAAVPFGTD